MPFEIRLDSENVKPDELANLSAMMVADLNKTDHIIAQKKHVAPSQGARTIELLSGAMVVELLQSAGISGLIGVLKAYVMRDKTLDLQLSFPDGKSLVVNAKNFRDSAVMDMLQHMMPGMAEARTQFSAAPAVDDPPEVAGPRRPAIAPLQTASVAALPNTDARKIAIVIGQGEFPEDPELAPLRYAVDDATAVNNLLSGETGDAFDAVELITDGAHHETLGRVEELAAASREDDLLLIYYAGHGLVRNQKLHLAFRNTKSNLVHSTAMKYGNLLDIVEQARARKRIVILDCCYAGAAGEPAGRSAVRDQVEQELANTRTLVLTAATSTQIARETEALGHGVFTKHLLDGLKGAADRNGDGSVDTDELFRYVQSRMSQDHLQEPQKFNYTGASAIQLRKTGKYPHREAAREILKKINNLHADGMLPLRYTRAFQRVLAMDLTEMNLEQEKQFRLLERSVEGPFKPGPLIDDWERIAPAAPQISAPPAENLEAPGVWPKQKVAEPPNDGRSQKTTPPEPEPEPTKPVLERAGSVVGRRVRRTGRALSAVSIVIGLLFLMMIFAGGF